MKKSLIIAFLIVAGISFCNNLYANENEVPQQNKWIEEVRNFKHSFIIKETAMTDEQSKVFIPLYTEKENKIYQANREARNKEAELSRSQTILSDEEYLQAAQALSNVTAIEAEIENTYFKIFSNILSPKQMFLLKRAENRFAIEMLNHNKKSKKQVNE